MLETYLQIFFGLTALGIGIVVFLQILSAISKKLDKSNDKDA